MMSRIVVVALLGTVAQADPKVSVVGKPAPAMTRVHRAHIALPLPDGRVVVLGGLNDDFKGLEAVEAFDPTTKAWKALAPMKQGHNTGAATVLRDGSILVIAG